jgi:hypothetical protein
VRQSKHAIIILAVPLSGPLALYKTVWTRSTADQAFAPAQKRVSFRHQAHVDDGGIRVTWIDIGRCWGIRRLEPEIENLTSSDTNNGLMNIARISVVTLK